MRVIRPSLADVPLRPGRGRRTGRRRRSGPRATCDLELVVPTGRPDATDRRRHRLGQSPILWCIMKTLPINSPVLVLAAAVVTLAPFAGLAWRTREWLGW
ncbi:hypothetical protein ACVOMV_33175 [Mesorhizobium atlanticum]